MLEKSTITVLSLINLFQIKVWTSIFYQHQMIMCYWNNKTYLIVTIVSFNKHFQLSKDHQANVNLYKNLDK